MGGERVKFGRESITLLQNNAKEKNIHGQCCGAGGTEIMLWSRSRNSLLRRWLHGSGAEINFVDLLLNCTYSQYRQGLCGNRRFSPYKCLYTK